jgi:hypothetical protein
MELHPEVAELAQLLRKIEGLLAKNGSARWSSSISRSRFAIENSDAWGLNTFLGMFGGMGSLNDLVLTRDGQALPAENADLQALLEEAWILGKRLQRETR